MPPTEKHFVTFHSPGTLFSESTTRAIDAWDPAVAAKMSTKIVERYDARPYGFQFSTSIVADPIDDGRGGKLNVEPREIAKSGMYYLNGKIETRAQVEARADPSEQILRDNMRANGMERIVVTVNGFKSVHPFEAADFLVNADGKLIARGTDR